MLHARTQRMLATLKAAGINITYTDIDKACQSCSSCESHKGQITNPKPVATRASNFNDEVSADLLPLQQRHILVLLDDATGLIALRLCESKDSTLIEAKIKAAWINTHGVPKRFRCDGGGEFQAIRDFLTLKGTEVVLTPPGTPSSNGRNERSHRTILEALRTTVDTADLPRTPAIITALVENHLQQTHNATANGTDLQSPFERAKIPYHWDVRMFPGRWVYFKPPLSPPVGKLSHRWSRGQLVTVERHRSSVVISKGNRLWRVHPGRVKIDHNPPKPSLGSPSDSRLHDLSHEDANDQNDQPPEAEGDDGNEPNVQRPPQLSQPPPLDSISQGVKNFPRVRTATISNRFQADMLMERATTYLEQSQWAN